MTRHIKCIEVFIFSESFWNFICIYIVNRIDNVGNRQMQFFHKRPDKKTLTLH